MVDSVNTLWLAKYNVKVSSLPHTFSLSPELEALRTKPINAHSFHRELEIISNFADMEQSNSKLKLEQQNNTLIDVSDPGELTVKVEEKKPTHEEIIAAMAQRTGQVNDVCYFYLESTGWDLEAAIELLQNFV